MSTDKGSLNAGAISFTPGGAGESPDNIVEENVAEEYIIDGEEYDVEEHTDKALDDIESEMDKSTELLLAEQMMNSATISSTTASSELPPHLANHASEFWFPEVRDCNCCKGYKHGCTCCSSQNTGVCQKCSAGSAPAPPTTSGGKRYGGKPKVPCKFFQSPSGCRFGDKCRFSHVM
mmetsp:Transcript_3733/g.5480  ORF Transcript_3733/g.5480 Transcript_3733/m.5480 type:complete len:177 (+) Transcript_3733:313-843(+)